jgi:predicted kinase
MLELVIFVGLQASGKSTYFREYLSATHEHVSKDLFPRAAKKDERQTQIIIGMLGAGKSVVVDNTNPTPVVRAPLIELGRRHGARVIAINFEATVKGSLERNRSREGDAKVPDVAIFATSRKLKPATADEGFDEIRTVTIEPPPAQSRLF